MTDVNESMMLEAFQLGCLLLPTVNRRQLHLLLRVINKMSGNCDLILESRVSNKEFVSCDLFFSSFIFNYLVSEGGRFLISDSLHRLGTERAVKMYTASWK